MNPILAMTFAVLLSGCDIANCIVDRYPQFSNDSLPVATLNQEYEVTLQADIHSSIEDNAYDYRVILEGSLPPGVLFQTWDRDVTFSGTPTELGDYPFTLNVYAEPEYPGPGIDPINEASELCDNYGSQEFIISVVQGS